MEAAEAAVDTVVVVAAVVAAVEVVTLTPILLRWAAGVAGRTSRSYIGAKGLGIEIDVLWLGIPLFRLLCFKSGLLHP